MYLFQILQRFNPYRLYKKYRLYQFHTFLALALLLFTLFIGITQANVSLNLNAVQTSIRNSEDFKFQFMQSTDVSVVELYDAVKYSVVTVTSLQPQNVGETSGIIQGSGFVYDFNGRMVIITNFHVINQATEISVTFSDGNGYEANILGFDPYVDLAVLNVNAPEDQFVPLEVVSSSNLKVGDFVVAVGSPFGLSGSMTTGIVSQIGRTITSPTEDNYPVANIIQTDASINPGNSGGPLLNSQGQVVGINTATVSESTGIGFAVPSNTLLREISDLINTGSYNRHPYLGISSIDMNYYIAQEMDVDVTYGVLLQTITQNGPADQAGLRAGTTQTTIDGVTFVIGGDIIIAINGQTIINTDHLSSYLEETLQPNQQITATIIRDGQTQDIQIVTGTRPPYNGVINPVPTLYASPTIPEITAQIIVLLLIIISMTILAVKYKKAK